MEIQKLLPKTSFVPFKAKRLINANVVYANLALFHEYGYFREYNSNSAEFYQQILDYFAYIVPNSDEDYLLVNNEEKEFLAERYGGAGILANGGGARCGLSGPFSLKGIGPAPVVGRDVDYWYSHGRMGLEEALSELFYSHLAHTALPVPSSRVLAVIDTGGTVLQRSFKQSINPYDDDCKHVRAGIIVRETRVRPAHFARAFYFKPSQYMKNHHVHDHQRVRNVIPFLPKVVGIRDPRLKVGERFCLAIDEILSKSALQLAYSKVRRVMHGSLGISNILVDGGWIDFGSATAVPSYEQLITAELQPAYWDEFLLFQKTAADLCFYVRKFQPQAQSLLGNSNDFYQKFVNLYVNHLHILFVELTGIPLFLLRNFMNFDWYKKLGALILHVAYMESPKAGISNWVLHAEEPAHAWSSISLRYVLQKLFYQYWILNNSFAPELALKQSLANELWESYCLLCRAVEAEVADRNISRESIVRFAGFNMVRQLLGITPFYRGHMLASIAEQLNQSSSPEEVRDNVEAMYAKYSRLGILHFTSSFGGRLLLASNASNMRLIWDLELGQYRVEIPQSAWLEFSAKNQIFLCYEKDDNSCSSTFQMDSQEGILFCYFDSSDIGVEQRFESISISYDDKNSSLSELFPDFDKIYSGFINVVVGGGVFPDSYWHSEKGLV